MNQSEITVMHVGSLIDGNEVTGGGRIRHEVRSPYNGELVGLVDFATKEDLEHAIQTAHRVFQQTMKKMPAYQRSEILRKAADALEAQREDFAHLLSREAGKPIRDARGEVGRAVQVLRFAADVAKANDGEPSKWTVRSAEKTESDLPAGIRLEWSPP
ncbi:aldehyde dehydrogenase family protein [Brevibacillus thermoruber]|uniref:aldehyde dehydrogenase family protein n=1 Tax=Brevibacillus thermoruber TaxID=33942 RepID=UPI0030839694